MEQRQVERRVVFGYLLAGPAAAAVAGYLMGGSVVAVVAAGVAVVAWASVTVTLRRLRR